MNCSSSHIYNDRSYEENSPGMLTAAILTAVFYSVTALMTMVLSIVGVFRGRSQNVSPKSLEDFAVAETNSAVSNVVDFQRYKLFRSQRD
jgi:hypothetical protein